MNLAIIVSHPIQHFCPQYASFAKNPAVKLKVFFSSTLGLKKYYDANFKKEVSWQGLYLDRFDHHFLNGDSAVPVTRELDSASLDHELDKFQPDILIIYGYYQKIQRRAYKWGRKNKVEVAYISDSEQRQKTNWFKGFLKALYLNLFFREIDFFLTVGDANEDFYKSCGVPSLKFVRMHFPIDINLYQNKFELRAVLRKQIRSKHHLKEDDFILSVVGKLVDWKNQDHIIDALILLEKKDVFAHLFIIGSGEMLDLWKNKAKILTKSKVHFTGFITPEELPSYYATTDVYVHPAGIEPHSIAISEAIYMACPVIVSDRSGSYGASDDVQVDANGEVFSFGDIDQLANKIKKFYDSPALVEKYSKHSHQRSLDFQQRSHGECLEELASRLASNKFKK